MTFNLAVNTQLIDDNVPVLMLDGLEMEVNFSTMFIEGQPNTNNPQIFLSRSLAIQDLDIGQQFLVEANVTIQGTEKQTARTVHGSK